MRVSTVCHCKIITPDIQIRPRSNQRLQFPDLEQGEDDARRFATRRSILCCERFLGDRYRGSTQQPGLHVIARGLINQGKLAVCACSIGMFGPGRPLLNGQHFLCNCSGFRVTGFFARPGMLFDESFYPALRPGRRCFRRDGHNDKQDSWCVKDSFAWGSIHHLPHLCMDNDIAETYIAMERQNRESLAVCIILYDIIDCCQSATFFNHLKFLLVPYLESGPDAPCLNPCPRSRAPWQAA